MSDLGLQIANLSAWVDQGTPDLDRAARTWGRIAFVAEEVGEAISAHIGATGQNPRKGVVGSTDDVIRELLDVAVAALAAVEHLDDNRGRSVKLLEDHVLGLIVRAALKPRVTATPADSRGITTCAQHQGYHVYLAGPCFRTLDDARAYRLELDAEGVKWKPQPDGFGHRA